MAKTGGFLAALGALLISAGRKSKRLEEAEQNYRRAVKDATRANSTAQAAYEKRLLAAPLLASTGRFDLGVHIEFADSDALDAYSQYLELMHDSDADFFVLLELESDEKSSRGAVRVDAGEATIGHLRFADEDDFVDLIDEHGPLRTSAKIEKLVNGSYEVWLDAAIPPRLEK